MSAQQTCESCERLRQALRECAERFKRCIVQSGTDPEFADAAVAEYRSLWEQDADGDEDPDPRVCPDCNTRCLCAALDEEEGS